MTTFTTLTSNDLDPDSPITTNLANAWYDNPLAIAQGDATVANANRIEPKAIKDSTTGTWPVADLTTGDVKSTVTTSYAKFIEAHCPRAGAVSVYGLVGITDSGSQTGYGKIYKNGVAEGAEFSVVSSGGSAQTANNGTESVTVAAGDTVELWLKVSATGTLTNFYGQLKLSVGNPLDYSIRYP